MKPIPQSVSVLLDELEAMYPPKCIGPKESVEEAQRYAGAVELVETLRLRYDWTRANATISEILPHV